MTRGVADDVRLGLDDTAARHAFGQRPHEHFADEKTSELGGIDGQFRPVQHARARYWRADFIHSLNPLRAEGPGSNGSPKYWVSRATLPSRNSMTLTE